MATSNALECCLLSYMPSIVGDKTVPLAVIFLGPAGKGAGYFIMYVAADWHDKVRVIDPGGDLEMVGAILSEIRAKLASASERSEMIRQLEDSFSNMIQISERRKCSFLPGPGAIKDFARELLGKNIGDEAPFAHAPDEHAKESLDRNAPLVNYAL